VTQAGAGIVIVTLTTLAHNEARFHRELYYHYYMDHKGNIILYYQSFFVSLADNEFNIITFITRANNKGEIIAKVLYLYTTHAVCFYLNKYISSFILFYVLPSF